MTENAREQWKSSLFISLCLNETRDSIKSAHVDMYYT